MKMKKFGQHIWNSAGSVAIGLCASFGGYSAAFAQVTAAQVPLFLSAGTDPNIMFVLDNSGSMQGEYMGRRRPSGVAEEDRGDIAYHRSSHVNKLYYNPAITYLPWAKPVGLPFPTAFIPVDAAAPFFPKSTPTAAPRHPIRNADNFSNPPTGDNTRNLTVDTTEAALCPEWWCIRTKLRDELFYPAVYYQYTKGDNFKFGSYQKVEIRSSRSTYKDDGRENRNECLADGCTYAQEIQNFANWYTYHRSSYLSAQAGIGRAFISQPEGMRVGFGEINKGTTWVDNVQTANVANVDGVDNSTLVLGVRPFSGDGRNNFFKELYLSVQKGGATPLRRALDDVGQYYSRADNLGPWADLPGTDKGSDHNVCRQSFAILMTDGDWTNIGSYDQAKTAGARANVDGSRGPTITADGPPARSFTYEPLSPFTDIYQNTLADVAMYYWNRDLRPTLANKVPSSKSNPAFWQHMVTYGVAFGVNGVVDPATAFGAIATQEPIVWENPNIASNTRKDDLLHAAVNGRGGYFSAGEPEVFSSELNSLLTNIVARVSAAGTSAATGAAVLQTDTLLYNAFFRSTDWSGTLVARKLNADGTPDLSTVGLAWDAEQKLAVRLASSRKIFTSTEEGVAVNFKLDKLSPRQRDALGANPKGAPASTATAADRINWLYGGDHAQLRSRLVDGITRRIGSIVGSAPQFMAERDFGYSMLPAPQGTSYGAFRTSSTYKKRPETLFVGSNSGMFHAFNATDGDELFAYVPSELLLPGSAGIHAQVNELMRPDYSHRFYLDGSSMISDAYTNGAWRTVAVGAMGAGGRTVFALDVTDPAEFGPGKVLWEFKHSNAVCVADPTGTLGSRACRDVGFGVTKPKIARLASGRWATVFGNGYNSFDHRARLMVVDLETGRLLYNLLTPDDTAQGGSASASNPNGLSPVETTDWPLNNLNFANAYAGDLLGNLWRFNFEVATPTVTRVFTAKDGSSPERRQPITATPIFALKPNSATEIVLLFGTGSFFKVGDDNIASPQVQTFYGIFDSASSPPTVPLRSDLLAQVLTSNNTSLNVGSNTYDAGGVRFLTQNSLTTGQRGWRVDLPSPGERVISNAFFPTGADQKRVRFSTLIPNDDPCGSGRQGFLMDIGTLSGGRSSTPAFDFNGDGVSNAGDATGGIQPSGIGGGTGEMLINIRDANGGTDNIYGGDGRLIIKGSNTSGPIGRQSWRQLR
jgi:type IV pilus assembly protein PilY1